jgi:16S rRNA (guanine(966)-N(2))-methyltransferase RsmD
MRVITGTAKGHHLKAPKGSGTRPMLDSVKGSLFAILEGYGVMHGRILDLYAGTGSIGIEALSRGVEWADFVEQKANVCAIIKENLTHTKLASRAKVYQQPVQRFVQQHQGGNPYTLVMMDPPYADPKIHETLELVAHAHLLVPGGILIIGHSIHVEFGDAYGPLERCEFRRFGGSCYPLFEMPESDGGNA